MKRHGQRNRRLGKTRGRRPALGAFVSLVLVFAVGTGIGRFLVGPGLESLGLDSNASRATGAPPRSAGDSSGHTGGTGPAQSADAAQRATDAPWRGKAVLRLQDRQRPWSDVFESPSESSSRLAQLLVGDRVEVLASQGAWREVRFGERGDPTGWVPVTALAPEQSDHGMEDSGDSFTVVAAPGVPCDQGIFLPCGARLRATGVGRPRGQSAADSSVTLAVPGGPSVRVDRANVAPLSEPLPIPDAIEAVRKFRRTRYQTGANSMAAMDAEGLVHLFFRLAGIRAPRTLEALADWGNVVSVDSAKVGDIAFLSTLDPGRSQPVILLDGGTTFLRASPEEGVGVGSTSLIGNRRILEVRRYR